MRSTPGSVQSIDRVLEILETLSTAPLGMSLSDLAAATGLHISTTHRLVNVLTEHRICPQGFLQRQISPDTADF